MQLSCSIVTMVELRIISTCSISQQRHRIQLCIGWSISFQIRAEQGGAPLKLLMVESVKTLSNYRQFGVHAQLGGQVYHETWIIS